MISAITLLITIAVLIANLAADSSRSHRSPNPGSRLESADEFTWTES